MELPDDCPAEYYNLMLKMWQIEPDRRPKFVDLQKMLKDAKPDVLKAINCCSDGQPDHLQYDEDDLVAVLDRRYMQLCYNAI